MPSRIEDLSEDERLALGILHSINGNTESASKYLKPLAEAGNLEAQTQLGLHLSDSQKTQVKMAVGQNVTADQSSYSELLKLALAKTDIQNGRVPSDTDIQESESLLQQVVQLCRTAAEHNDPQAEYTLGMCYQHGWGVPWSHPEACRYFARAWTHGDRTGFPAMYLTLLYSLEARKSAEMEEIHQLWRERARLEGIDRIAADW